MHSSSFKKVFSEQRCTVIYTASLSLHKNETPILLRSY